MTTQTEALKMALEALEQSQQILDEYMTECVTARQATNEAITAIKEALQSNEQVEPVAKVDSRFDSQVVWYLDQLPKDGTKLYTHPSVPDAKLTAQPEIEYQERILRLEGALKKALAQPKPLTDEKISLIAHNTDTCDWNDLNFKECWHKGFKAGFREAEIEHNIKG